MVTRTKTESSLGLAAANINQWGAGIPFGTQTLTGATRNAYFDIPDSLIDVNGDGVADAGDRTHPAYRAGGRFGVNCDAPLGPATPWADGLPGCTNSEAWPISPEIYNLMMTRLGRTIDPLGEPRTGLDAKRARRRPLDEQRHDDDELRRSASRATLPSGDHSWDVSLSTGRSDNTVNQLGSMRLHSYRDVLASPNFGRNATFDPESVGVRRLRRKHPDLHVGSSDRRTTSGVIGRLPADASRRL